MVTLLSYVECTAKWAAVRRNLYSYTYSIKELGTDLHLEKSALNRGEKLQ